MDLQNFISEQEAQGDLKRIKVSIDPHLEIAALCRREFAAGNQGGVLLFEQPAGFAIPLVANLFGRAERTAQILRSRSLVDFSFRLADFFQNRTGSTAERLQVSDSLEKLQLQPSCQQVIAAVNLLTLPAIQSWPGEQKPYLTLALLISQHPETGQRNLGLYRVQIIDQQRVAINFSVGSGAGEHLAAAQRMQQPLPACLILGGDPAWIWAAAAPLPPDCDEFGFCRQLFDADDQFAAALTQPLSIPANAEIVIEGELLPGDVCHEGPFGNHTGQYVSRPDCPVMQVTAISHRERPLMPITVVGPPPSENIHLAQANEILLREMLKIDYPQVRDLKMPLETIFHGVSLLAVAPQSTAENKALIYSLWQQSPLRKAKVLILLDADIALSSFSQGWWRTINQLDNKRIYQDQNRLAIDATGVDPTTLVVEDQPTIDLLKRRSSDYKL